MIDIETPRSVEARTTEGNDLVHRELPIEEDVNGHGGPAVAAAVGFGLIGGAAAGVALVGAVGLAAAAGAAAVGYAQGVADSKKEDKPATAPGT